MALQLVYRLWRAEICDSTVGVFFDGRWIGRDGVILDCAYRER